jgi:hypothetical protein
MLHTNEIKNENEFKWHEWYCEAPFREEFQRVFSQELRDDRHLRGVNYYIVCNGDTEPLLLIKTSLIEHRTNLSLATIKNCNIALCLKNALEEKIVTQCLGEHAELILITNILSSMREVFEQLANFHKSEPIEGIISILIGSDHAVRIHLRSTLPFIQSS